MAQRILTGILKVNQGSYNAGKATINFNPFGLDNNSDATLQFATSTPASSKDFKRKPHKIVSMRQFYAHHEGQSNPSLWDYFEINDGDDSAGEFDNQHLVVRWFCQQPTSGIMEMTVLIIGETA